MEEPRRLGGRYELGSVLGRGGMAEVYLAHDTRLGRTVAVKTLRVDLARDPSFQARFRREAQSAASLNHPAIVAVYDTGEDYVDGVSIPYIVMEYVDGSTLRELLHSGRKLLPERAMEMCIGILQALEYSHRSGIVHRDIKPANVMLTRNGQVKVMDFGIARAMGDSGMTMTQTAAVIGTAQYLSPEQAKGEQVDSRSDLYSTGCLIYELLTNRPPFVGDSPVAVAYQHVREEPQPTTVFDPEISPDMDAIVMKALVKDPDYRYQSADEMRADIEACLDGQPVAATAAHGRRRLRRLRRRPAHHGAARSGRADLDDAARPRRQRRLLRRGARPAAPAQKQPLHDPARRSRRSSSWSARSSSARRSSAAAPATPSRCRRWPGRRTRRRRSRPRTAASRSPRASPSSARNRRTASATATRRTAPTIDRGDTVTVSISKGPPPIDVPDVEGDSYADAKQ